MITSKTNPGKKQVILLTKQSAFGALKRWTFYNFHLPLGGT